VARGRHQSAILYLQTLLITFVLVLASTLSALEVPPLRGRVNDLAGLLPLERARRLEERLAQFEAETGHQIAVLTIPSLKGEDIAAFGIRVAETWKIGQKGFDNGVILIVAKDDQKLRIEVGYGLEGVLPDVIASRIIREIIVPDFRGGDFAGGIEAGVDAILKVTRGEPLPQRGQAETGARGSGAGDDVAAIAAFFVAPFCAFMVGTFFGMFFRKKESSTIKRLLLGGVSGAITSVLVASLFGALALVGLGILIVILGFSLGALGSLREFWRSGEWSGTGRRRHVGWDTAGGSGGRGFGSGGGFSGGGGGFGGGGASGSW
jgi:uncharacterized protein